MLIRSKFSSTCRVCGGNIEKGERIDWARGQGARHTKCVLRTHGTGTEIPIADQKLPVKPDFFDWLGVLLPLGLCPVWVLYDAKTAFTACYGFPLLLALVHGGLAPTGGRQPVKWGYRRQYVADVSFNAINAMALLSAIPGAITWLIVKLI